MATCAEVEVLRILMHLEAHLPRNNILWKMGAAARNRLVQLVFVRLVTAIHSISIFSASSCFLGRQSATGRLGYIYMSAI